MTSSNKELSKAMGMPGACYLSSTKERLAVRIWELEGSRV
jgi:hypothetical protein